MDCSPPSSSVHEILQARILGVGCHFPLQGSFPMQGLNPGLLHCRQILYWLSCEGRAGVSSTKWYSFNRCYIYVCVYICVYICVCVYVCVCICVYIYVCVYVCVYIYTYINLNHFVVQLQLTHYKSNIFQYKKILIIKIFKYFFKALRIGLPC